MNATRVTRRLFKSLCGSMFTPLRTPDQSWVSKGAAEVNLKAKRTRCRGCNADDRIPAVSRLIDGNNLLANGVRVSRSAPLARRISILEVAGIPAQTTKE